MTLNPMKRRQERCREVRSQMSDYLDGDLSPDASAAVDRHTRWCLGCGRMLRNLRRTVVGLGALREVPIPDQDPPETA